MGILTAAIFIVIGIGIQRLLIDPTGFIQDGALLICENRDKIFLLRDGILHALPEDIQLAQDLGFNLTKITEVSCEILAEFPEGEPVEELISTDEGLLTLSKMI